MSMSRGMAGVAMLKGKYMPLSEANVRPTMVSSYDGQYVCVGGGSSDQQPPYSNNNSQRDVRYCMGNYLGGGIAGVVYEAFDKKHARSVAIKILNPVGYKLCSPATLRRGEIVKKGVPVLGNVRGMTLENVYWVSVPNRRDLIACYVDARSVSAAAAAAAGSSSTSLGVSSATSGGVVPAMLRELTLEMCVSLWLLDGGDDWRGDARSERLYRSCEDPVDDSQSRGEPRRRLASGRRRNSSSTLFSSASMREERKDDNDDSDVCTSSAIGSSSSGANNYDSERSAASADADARMMSAIDALLCDEEVVVVGDAVHTIPKIPAKYDAFLTSRKTIYREIAHMHKLTGNSVSGQVGGGHANVLKLYDVLEFIQPSKSTIFLVLELAHGGELFDRIRSDNGVDATVARMYFAQLLAGVLYCHQLGIVHRDLKPENLLLSDTDVLKIADFGLSAHFIAAVSNSAQDDDAALLLARSNSFQLLDMDAESSGSGVMTPARFRRLNSIVGSPHYVAPEVLQNARYGYDGRKADMWSIGVILYGLLVGNLPFGKDLQTCARYLKFCEWIRSLASDAVSGKLVFDADAFDPNAPVRSNASREPSCDSDRLCGLPPPTVSSQPRMAQVFPSHHQPMAPAFVPPSSLWSSASTVSKPPASALSVQTSNDAGAALSGAVGRRGSRSVMFPSWFFPSKLSPDAVYLLASLLHPDPAKRFSCEDACRSRWVAADSMAC